MSQNKTVYQVLIKNSDDTFQQWFFSTKEKGVEFFKLLVSEDYEQRGDIDVHFLTEERMKKYLDENYFKFEDRSELSLNEISLDDEELYELGRCE